MNKYSFMGISIHLLTMKDLNETVVNAARNNQKIIIPNHNLHSMYLCNRNSRLREFYNMAQFIHIDGMAIVLIGKLLGYPVKREHRTTYVDWIRPLLKVAYDNRLRVFYLGSKPGVASQAASILRKELPNLQIGTQDGYFNADTNCDGNKEIIRRINEFKPHILLVGMGMPRQESWILDNYEQIHTNVILTSGACMDYVADIVPTAPRLLGAVGLEWLFRLWCEPRRLWKRYLIEPWTLFMLFIAELLRKNKGAKVD
ncbi:glycosyl transferase [Paenibacillus sp. Soil766]|uniref:WecB/TagA/CpsF family glycosyltransferase n=1 Tax=Paenibacillus sp. Soil766 TaxID=1736404 RepID=UPI00071019AF|nr:WecB/TagA/CpsF family glycosyltransferase [Paenibacillus sp. Soil766]KRE97108.1 glycosyl transferase [Paenibacillus sp. Soil766]